jgi:hypothetical protein
MVLWCIHDYPTLSTLLKIARKTKDTINARVDLEEMGV